MDVNPIKKRLDFTKDVEDTMEFLHDEYGVAEMYHNHRIPPVPNGPG